MIGCCIEDGLVVPQNLWTSKPRFPSDLLAVETAEWLCCNRASDHVRKAVRRALVGYEVRRRTQELA